MTKIARAVVVFSLLMALSPTSAGAVQPAASQDLEADEAIEVFVNAAPELMNLETPERPTSLEGAPSVDLASENGQVDMSLPEELDGPVTVVDRTDSSGPQIATTFPFEQSAELIAGDAGAAYDNGNGSFTVPMPQNDGSLVIGIVIESADAPTEYAFELKVPSGATLKPLEQGVGLYDSNGNLFGGVAPPWARDAAGQAIDTHLEIRGDTVVQTVAHRSGQIAYPVSADPWLGLDLLDWTSRSDCPNSRCPGRSSGYVISAGLSAWGVYWRYTGSGTAILNGSGWSELVSKRPAADNNNNRMRPQWTCHAIGAYPPLTGGSWDLESWRPEIWDSAVWWQSRCNW